PPTAHSDEASRPLPGRPAPRGEPAMIVLSSLRPAAVLLVPLLWTCAPVQPAASAHSEPAPIARSEGLILQAGEGERRVRRSRADGQPGLTTPFILKVDRRNG